MNLNTITNAGGMVWNVWTTDKRPKGFLDATDHGSVFRTERLALGWIKRQARTNGGGATFAIVLEGPNCYSVYVGREGVIVE